MNNKRTLSRRKFLNKSSSAAAGLAAVAGLSGMQNATAHPVDLNAVSPTPEQVQAFLALPEQPVVMVNLLKFKPNGGAEEYAKYAEGVRPLVEGVGGRFLFFSTTAMCLLGNADWDTIALVEYPSPAALIQMSASAEYQAIAGYRTAGLEGQVNYAVWQNS